MNIQDNSVMIRLSFGRIGGHKKADKDKVDTGNTEKDSLTLSKKLFTCDEYHAISKADGQVKRWVLNRAIQVPLGYTGVYILPLGLLGDVDERLIQFRQNRDQLVEAFLNVYDFERDRARVRLGDQFSEADYPPISYVRQKFHMEWRYVTFKVPTKLPPEVEKRERDALRRSLQETETEVRAALREGMANMVSHLVDRLTPDPDGNKKVFRDSAVNNLVEFLDLLDKRDITNDDSLRQLSEQAKRVIGNHSAESLRDASEHQKADISKALAEVAERAGELVETVRKRKFNWED